MQIFFFCSSVGQVITICHTCTIDLVDVSIGFKCIAEFTAAIEPPLNVIRTSYDRILI